jgi:hypothetical protein
MIKARAAGGVVGEGDGAAVGVAVGVAEPSSPHPAAMSVTLNNARTRALAPLNLARHGFPRPPIRRLIRFRVASTFRALEFPIPSSTS